MISALFGLALAQDPGANPPLAESPAVDAAPVASPVGDASPTDSPDAADEALSPWAPGEELVVYGQPAIRAARDALIRDLERLGWESRRDGDVVRFRAPERWMGKATLDPNGTLTFDRTYLGVAGGGGTETAPYPEEGALHPSTPLIAGVSEADVAAGAPASDLGRAAIVVPVHVDLWVMPSARKQAAVWDRVVAEVEPELRALRRALDETAWRDARDALPGRLERTWTQGAPLISASLLPDAAARREEIAAYWLSLPQGPHGDVLAAIVEDFVTAVVQPSPDPFPGAVSREDGRVLAP